MKILEKIDNFLSEEYKVKQNPSDKKWYVMKGGKMASSGYKSENLAKQIAKRMEKK
jgi:hypothetical protein